MKYQELNGAGSVVGFGTRRITPSAMRNSQCISFAIWTRSAMVCMLRSSNFPFLLDTFVEFAYSPPLRYRLTGSLRRFWAACSSASLRSLAAACREPLRFVSFSAGQVTEQYFRCLKLEGCSNSVGTIMPPQGHGRGARLCRFIAISPRPHIAPPLGPRPSDFHSPHTS